MTVEYLANLAEIVGAIMIVGGAVFGIVQVRELKRKRCQQVKGRQSDSSCAGSGLGSKSRHNKSGQRP